MLTQEIWENTYLEEGKYIGPNLGFLFPYKQNEIIHTNSRFSAFTLWKIAKDMNERMSQIDI